MKEGYSRDWRKGGFESLGRWTEFRTARARQGRPYTVPELVADLTGQTVDHVKSRFYVQSQNAKNRRLAYTWHFDIFLAPDEKPHDVPISVDLEPVKEGTKMTFKQGPLATAEFTEGSRQGVLANFDRLAKALERKA